MSPGIWRNRSIWKFHLIFSVVGLSNRAVDSVGLCYHFQILKMVSWEGLWMQPSKRLRAPSFWCLSITLPSLVLKCYLCYTSTAVTPSKKKKKKGYTFLKRKAGFPLSDQAQLDVWVQSSLCWASLFPTVSTKPTVCVRNITSNRLAFTNKAQGLSGTMDQFSTNLLDGLIN